MPNIELRQKEGVRSAGDLIVTVRDNTFEYLLTSPAPEIRVSAYLDRDWPEVQASYAEVFVSDDCPFQTKIMKVIPGSRTRTQISLPGPMSSGEQLTLEVVRSSR